MGNGVIKHLIDCVLSVVYSNDDCCVLCKGYVQDEELLCSTCFDKIKFYNKSFFIKRDGIEIECFSVAYYSGVIMELVRRLKYNSDFNSGEVLANSVIKLLESNVIEYDLITFVPMTNSSLKARGFNQSKYLAVEIAKRTGIPIKELIRKIKTTKDQIGLSAENRWENINQCFKTKDKKIIQNKKILLVDDVVTTGATAFCCSKELLESGAKKVIVLTTAKSKL
jgi:competence protein ComFC